MTATADWLTKVSFNKPRKVTDSAWMAHAAFGFWLIEQLRPRSLVELGSWKGYSYLAFCQQIVESQVACKSWAVDTWQGDEHAGFYGNEIYANLKAYHDPLYGAFSTLVRATFDEAVSQFEDGSIDLLHIDGRHFYEDVKHDFKTWERKLSDRAVVLFHDTQVRENDFGVWQFWEEISKDRPSFEFHHCFGLGVLCYGTAPDVLALPIFAEPSEAKAQKIRHAYEVLGELLVNGAAIGQRLHLKRNELCPCGSGERVKRCHGTFL